MPKQSKSERATQTIAFPFVVVVWLSQANCQPRFTLVDSCVYPSMFRLSTVARLSCVNFPDGSRYSRWGKEDLTSV